MLFLKEKREKTVLLILVKSGVRKGHAMEALVNEMTQALTENVTQSREEAEKKHFVCFPLTVFH